MSDFDSAIKKITHALFPQDLQTPVTLEQQFVINLLGALPQVATAVREMGKALGKISLTVTVEEGPNNMALEQLQQVYRGLGELSKGHEEISKQMLALSDPPVAASDEMTTTA